MTREDIKQRVKQDIKITRFLTPSKSGLYNCPFCGSGTGNNGKYTGAFEVYEDNTGFCHACANEALDGKPADSIALEMYTTGKDYNEAFFSLADELGLQIDEPAAGNAPKNEFKRERQETPDKKEKALKTQNTASQGQTADYTEYYQECYKRILDPEPVKYLESRGLSSDVAIALQLGYDPAADPANRPGGEQIPGKNNYYPTPRIIIPVTKNHYVARAINPDINPAFAKMNNAGANIGIFNEAALFAERPVIFITEGAFNALSFIAAGATGVALNSANNVERLLSLFDEKKPTAPLVLCLDRDEAGRTAEKKLSAGLAARGIAFICRDITGGYGDNNDYLIADKAGFADDIKKATEAAKRAADKTGLTAFLDEIYTDKYKPVKTGIAALDELLNGGFVRQNLVLLSGAPGSGKTALLSQIFERMAAAAQPGIFLNLEMSKNQLIARSLSRRIFENHKGKLTALNILQAYSLEDPERNLINEAAAEYRDEIGENLQYNPAGIGTDVNEILAFMDETGRAAAAAGKPGPNFCIDYLQLITGGKDPQETIKQALAGFKDYAIRYNAIVICIMAQSRAVNNLHEAVLGSGRDSSSAEYTADLQIQLLTAENEPETKTAQDPDEITLYVTKSRFTEASTKRGLKFAFYGAYSFLAASKDGFIPLENCP